jgi:tetratricopeptide (TPR) repeat protein
MTSGTDTTPLPAQIGGYSIESCLGRGGMGAVYRARSPRGQLLAVKVLHAELLGPDDRTRFEQEACLRVDHPNVVQVLDGGVDSDGRPFIALELLQGESVQERAQRAPMPYSEVVDVGRQVCRGLAAAHAQGIVHRDLKPANLFRCADGTVKILDFGIALVDSGATRLTRTGTVLGTAAYMSPEQVRGDGKLDARTDVWSLGAVLYELIAGQPPFLRDTALATLFAIHLEDPPALASLASNVPASLAAVVGRALLKPATQRWASAAVMEAALAGLSLDTASAAARGRAAAGGGPALPPTETAAGPPQPTVPLRHGERRVVAILLADGVRSMDALAVAVGSQGGILLPLLGSRAIGLFGADRWDGDEASRAMACALEARGHAEWISVASGRATARGAGLAGEVLDAAERGCAARLSGVAVDLATARGLDSRFVRRTVEPGLCEVSARRAPDPTASLPSAPLLGRDAEMAQFRGAVDRVGRDSRHAVLLVVGPPGVGKTRLRAACEQEIERHAASFRVFAGRGEPLRRHDAFALAASMLASAVAEMAATPGGPGGRPAAIRRLADGAAPEEAAAADLAAFVAALLGEPWPATPGLLAARTDPQLMVDRLRMAVLDLFEGIAASSAVALCIEDLQWADRDSLDLLEALVQRLARAPLLLLATTRPELLEQRPDLFAGTNLARMEPGPLGRGEIDALAVRSAGRALRPLLLDAIAARTGGHPLFVEQIVVELGDRGLLDADVESLPIPLTVEAAIQSRLDHLPAAEREACRLAAVLGRPFLAAELEAVGAAAATDLLRALAWRDLVAARGRPGSERVYQFRSAIVADVVYSMIGDETKRDLHRRVALALRDRTVPRAELARHFELGGEAEEAAECYSLAAAEASASGDAATVLRCSERALSLGVPPGHRFALHMARSDALRYLGRRDEQELDLSAALSLAASHEDRARVLCEQTVLWTRSGRRAEALAAADAAVLAARKTGNADSLAHARGWQVGALLYGGQPERALRVYEAALRGADAASVHTRAVLAGWRGHVASALGDLGARRNAFSESAALYREAGDLRRAASAQVNFADVANRIGSFAEAEEALRGALEDSRRVGNRTNDGYALVNLGYAVAMQGRLEEARACLDEALAIARASGQVRLGFWARLYLLRASLGAGSAEAALSLADESGAAGERGVRILALCCAARACQEGGQLAEAARHAEQAFDELRAAGPIEEEEAEVYLVRAQSLRALGRHEDAADAARQGCSRVRDLASRIADPELQRSFLERVPAHRALLSLTRLDPTGR